jgi:UDP-glucose-4-epimerase GalE
MNVLVTGGAGYIGSHAARKLAQAGHTPVIYDNLSNGHRRLAQGFELIVADIGDATALAPVLQRVDAVMHFAAFAEVKESVENPRRYFENNVRSALTLLNCTVDAGIRKFIFSSTCAVYGEPARVPIVEDTPRQPINPYGATKLLLEHALESYSRAYGLRSVRLRYFNAAGADESGDIGELHHPESHLIPIALQAAAGQRPHVEIYGTDYPTPDGTCIRDYIHVNDLAEAHVMAVEYLDRGGDTTALNLGTGRGTSVKEIADQVERVTGRPLNRKFSVRRPGDPPELVADPARAAQVLRWRARYSVGDMVQTAWNFLQKQGKPQLAAGERP